MNIHTVVVGDFQVNCYLVSNDRGKALVIDPGGDTDEIALALEKHELTVAAYLITHGHMDHISALAELANLHPAPVCIHPSDEKWAYGGANQMLPYYGVPARPAMTVRRLADGQQWEDEGIRYRVITTPGHTPGGVCFHLYEEKMLFTGDTLFAGSVGRTDFAGSSDTLLDESLMKLIRLPDDTVVYPGHGPATTIGREKKSNPFLRHKLP